MVIQIIKGLKDVLVGMKVGGRFRTFFVFAYLYKYFLNCCSSILLNTLYQISYCYASPF